MIHQTYFRALNKGWRRYGDEETEFAMCKSILLERSSEKRRRGKFLEKAARMHEEFIYFYWKIQSSSSDWNKYEIV